MYFIVRWLKQELRGREYEHLVFKWHFALTSSKIVDCRQAETEKLTIWLIRRKTYDQFQSDKSANYQTLSCLTTECSEGTKPRTQTWPFNEQAWQATYCNYNIFGNGASPHWWCHSTIIMTSLLLCSSIGEYAQAHPSGTVECHKVALTPYHLTSKYLFLRILPTRIVLAAWQDVMIAPRPLRLSLQLFWYFQVL